MDRNEGCVICESSVHVSVMKHKHPHTFTHVLRHFCRGSMHVSTNLEFRIMHCYMLKHISHHLPVNAPKTWTKMDNKMDYFVHIWTKFSGVDSILKNSSWKKGSVQGEMS